MVAKSSYREQQYVCCSTSLNSNLSYQLLFNWLYLSLVVIVLSSSTARLIQSLRSINCRFTVNSNNRETNHERNDGKRSQVLSDFRWNDVYNLTVNVRKNQTTFEIRGKPWKIDFAHTFRFGRKMCPTKQDKVSLGFYRFILEKNANYRTKTKMPLGQAICIFILTVF